MTVKTENCTNNVQLPTFELSHPGRQSTLSIMRPEHQKGDLPSFFQ